MLLMRIGYAAFANILMALAFTDVLRPAHVFIIAGIAGLARPSDLAMRSALVARDDACRSLHQRHGCCGTRLLLTLLIVLHWRPALWPLEAQANTLGAQIPAAHAA
jgi:hypothetical protein